MAFFEVPPPLPFTPSQLATLSPRPPIRPLARSLLAQKGGVIALTDFYCTYNRLRGGFDLVSPEDILEASLSSAGADNGCCGSDGLDGPNRACSCGSLVATQWSDCWTQAEVRFLPDAVRVSERA